MKISRTVLLVLIALILLAWLAIQTPPVQNWLVHQVAKRLSNDLNTTVSIKHVDFSLFNKMHIEEVLIKDRAQDTLLSAGALKVNITDWFFFKDNIELKYVGLENAVIHLQRTDATWNYRFIIDYFSGPKETTPSSKEGINLDLKKVEFDNITLIQRDAWRGEDQTLSFRSLDIDADKVSFVNKQVLINSFKIEKPLFAIYNYDGNRPDSLRPRPDPDTVIINDPNRLRWNPGAWDIAIKELTLDNGTFRSDKDTERKPYDHFDGAHILFSEINGTFTNVTFKQDTIAVKMTLRTKERGGLIVKKLNADLKVHPEAMEFANMDLHTNRSRLHHFFAMRYNSFDDMGDFITNVRMEGDFNEAELDSDDIAYFAPDMKTWKKKIRINGRIRGSVDNLSAKNLVIEAGKHSYLNGNVSLRGLPDIDKTFIDFEARDFRTTYPDAITIIPQLKNIQQPRLDLLEFLHFKGNFTGFVNDFVTYGTLTTKLGTLVTDVNMKFPNVGHTSYTGNLSTNDFLLGPFINVPQMGRINFKGSVNGRGLKTGNLNAKLDGTIRYLEVNNYPYENIIVKGTVAKRLFNGELTISDTNVNAHLDGLVDFSKDIPKFNFKADVTRANLKRIYLTKDSVDVSGKFDFDFTGNNIDNFLGTARIYDASVYRNGNRVSFDSLNVESKVMGNNKVITVLSNEFDAALVGEFSIRDLPAAFTTFLNKYFPSYIKPAKTLTTDENFSFVITTKKIDEYLDFIDKDLDGFNFSTITGRINSKENLLDLNVEIPELAYRNIRANNLSLKGTGNLDSLSVESSIADIYVNDSLHFPGTQIRVGSSSDLSQVSIKTSANQTINTANVSAMVQTMPKGVRIIFNKSNFDVNGKTWTIDKDGELVFSETLVSAEGVKIYSGDQEVLITTHPSDIGNTNDIKVELNRINIGDFSPYVAKKNRLEGLLTATVDIMDPFGKMQVDLNGEAEQFRLDDDSLGKVQLTGNYSLRTGIVNFGAKSDNVNYLFDLKGAYNTKDSLQAVPLDIVGEFKDTRIHLLEKYLSGVFSNLDGFATGNLRVTGAPDKLKYLGKVALRDGTLRVNYTNVLYKIPSAVFDFRDGYVDFGSFAIKDEFGNTGQVSKGILKHEGFDQLEFDFGLNTNKLLVLSTNATAKDPFFGTVFAKVNMTLRGPLADMQMYIRGEPADSSKLFIRSNSSKQGGQDESIVWKVYGREMKAPEVAKESNLTVSLDIAANNYVNMFVIIDELTGDIIQANGHGNLKLKAGTTGEFTMTGRYDIDRGNYNFNFQSLLRKPFKLREGVGNYIQWKGDPFDADIKIDAEYHAENVRFSDLGLDNFTLASGSGVNQNVRKYRGEVIVIASLTEKLMQPTIKFQIELPTGSPLKNDPDALAILQRIESDENELNKQVAFLIVFDSFGPVSSGSQSGLGTIAFEGVVVNSISGVVSNALSRQFSNIFQKIFNDKSIKVNFNAQLYSGTNLLDNADKNKLNIDRTNLNLNIGKSFLNERLTFTFGSALDFGLSSQQVAATNNLQFLPDITAEWKIRQDGKLVLTFFYRDSYNYLTGTSTGARQNRSGASISYRRDFERFGDLFRNERKKKNRAKPPVVPPVDSSGSQ